MFKRLTKGCVAIVQKYLPDPFIFAIILTLVVFVAAIATTGQGPMAMIGHWSGGLWNLLGFSMQMALILVTGHALANAPLLKRGLAKMASIAKTPTQAIVLVTFVAIIASWINWGFGLVIGALYAKELARKVKGVDYRLLIASAYSGFLVWHGGLSGSIPLKLATAEGLSKATNGAVTEAISTQATIFSAMNLAIVGVLLLTLPLINRAMHPKKAEEVVEIDPALLVEEEIIQQPKSEKTPADKLETSPILSILIGAMGLAYVVNYFINAGFSLNLNIVNAMFLFSGILLHYHPRNYVNAVKNAVKGTSGIILQFPFYAGIMGMMTGAPETGFALAEHISNGFVSISNTTTFPLFSFLSAGIVNFFVPSGGGQWAVQAPIMMSAGADLGVPAAKTAMSIAWGDAWTNMIQPFWALPALGIAGLGAKDIMGFCLIDLLYSGVVIAIMMLIF